MPKCALYYIENHKIEVVNTIFGKEKVLLNGVTVSEKPAEVGTEHRFAIGGHNYSISQRDKAIGEKLNRFEIRKDGAPISLINILTKKSPLQMLVLIIICGLGCGFIFGVLIYNLIT